MKHIYCAFIWLLIISCQAQHPTTIPFNSSQIRYEGRILYRSNAAELTWPGTSVTAVFEGDSIFAVLKDLDTANYYNVVIDDAVKQKIHPDTIKRRYLLASGLSSGKHVVQLFKRTEWDKGKTLFYGFELSGNSKLLTLPAEKTRKIEFFGNSITCGYAMEDSSENDSGTGYFENGYLSYAAITARHFNAQLHSTSKSGIGITVSWFPLIMPEMYDRLDPFDSTSKWDFKKFTPQIVVINLFQNDSWLVKNHEHEQFKFKFGQKEPDEKFIINAYLNFVKSIRSKYPDAHIICALGSMDATQAGSPWPGYISKAVVELNDKKIYTHFFPYKNTPGHPKVSEQNDMAMSLIQFIDRNIQW